MAANTRAGVRPSTRPAHEIDFPFPDAGYHGEPDRLMALPDALAGNEIEVHFQPLVDAVTHQRVGAEALLRWRHRTDGLLTAGSFARAAEHVGLLGALGQLALAESGRALAAWAAPTHFAIHVNANMQQLAAAGFADDVARMLAANDQAPSRLIIEITETMALTTSARPILTTLNALRELGVGIELDDFGTGYASPLFLKYLPLTGVKIDGSFVAGIGHNRQDEAIVTHLTHLALDFGFTVCGEGVETAEQCVFLRTAGATKMQGYLFDRAMPADEFGNGFTRSAPRAELAL
jgi:EAL domain-containing protein (putative c-di-GMP-specific phosphodiesterase class I)